MKKIDEVLAKDLKQDEGIRLKPYHCKAGKLTIGIGRNLDDKGITMKEAEYLMGGDIAECIVDLKKIFAWDSLSFDCKRVLVNMRFNLGPVRFRGFKKMIEAVQDNRLEAAAFEMLDSRWAKQVGNRAKRLAELMRRAGK